MKDCGENAGSRGHVFSRGLRQLTQPPHQVPRLPSAPCASTILDCASRNSRTERHTTETHKPSQYFGRWVVFGHNIKDFPHSSTITSTEARLCTVVKSKPSSVLYNSGENRLRVLGSTRPHPIRTSSTTLQHLDSTTPVNPNTISESTYQTRSPQPKYVPPAPPRPHNRWIPRHRPRHRQTLFTKLLPLHPNLPLLHLPAIRRFPTPPLQPATRLHCRRHHFPRP
jgi:hypothetical protein